MACLAMPAGSVFFIGNGDVLPDFSGDLTEKGKHGGAGAATASVSYTHLTQTTNR